MDDITHKKHEIKELYDVVEIFEPGNADKTVEGPSIGIQMQEMETTFFPLSNITNHRVWSTHYMCFLKHSICR
jgi:hypothetical protein